MRVLVTGAAGFIGSHLVEGLLAGGHEVAGIDNFDPFYPPAVKMENMREALGHPNFRLSTGSLLDDTAVEDVMGEFKPDVVYHLAAVAGVRPSIERPMAYVRLNVEATQRVLSSCARHEVDRVVLAGSSSVYGSDTQAPFEEDSASEQPRSPYAATKRAMELLGAAHASVYDTTVTVCRFFTVYGPRQRPDLAISRFVRAMIAEEPITIFGDGSFSRDFTYVEDTVRGLIASLAAPDGYQVYNLGGGSPVSVLDLVQTIEQVLGKNAEVRHGPEQKGDVPLTYASVTKAKEQLGWQARIGLREGIERFVQWVERAPAPYFQVGEPWSFPPVNAAGG